MAQPGTRVLNNRPHFVTNDDIGLSTINRDVDTSVARVFIKRPNRSFSHVQMGCIEILYFKEGQQPTAYNCWLNCGKGVFAAMRNAGETTPLYHHDFVDAN